MNKKILFISLATLFILNDSAYSIWPFTKNEPASKEKIEKVEPSVKPTINNSRILVKELSNELKSAKNENSNLKKSLERALLKVKNAEERTIEVQNSADELKKWGIIQQEQAQKFIEKYNSAVKRYHRLKILAAVIAAGVGILLGLQFMNLTPPPYNIGVPVGGAALFASLVWFLL